MPDAPQEKAVQPDHVEREIDEIIAECGGPRAAIRVLLHDLEIVCRDRNESVSRGYARGTIYRLRQRAK